MRDLRYLRWWLALGGLLVALVVYFSLAGPLTDVPVPITDKYAHTLAYFVLMSWFCGQFLAHRRVQPAAFLMALGVALEFLQGWSGLRVFEWLDMLANGLGIALGWLAAHLGLGGWSAWCERRMTGAGSVGGG